MSEKIQVKVFTNGPVNAVDYVPVFHRWIRERVFDELLIDVVDYSHVTEGPEVALIGHESDYVLDRREGRQGLLYVNKRGNLGSDNPFSSALKRVANVCRLLESEREVPPLSFDAHELQVRIADRLAAPNTDDTFRRVEPLVRDAILKKYGRSVARLERKGSPRELFTVNAHIQ